MLPFITAYGPKTRVLLSFPEQPHGRTKQAFRDESNINNIVAQFLKTGTLEFTRKHEPQYGDVTGADFQTAMDTILAAKSMFADLPAKLRSRFANDPAQFLDFVQDEDNREEATRLGLLKPRAPGATPLAPRGAEGAEQPQNRTQDGRFTFDKPPAGPSGDGKTNSNT